MQERSLQAQASRTMGDGFQSRSPQAEQKNRLYLYVVSMDGVRYHITLKKALIKTDKKADLLHMKEEDFSEVSREGRPIEPAVFVSAYSRFFRFVDSEPAQTPADPGPAHTIEIFYSLASL